MAEPNDDAPNFDISGLLGGALNMMQGVKGMADNSRKTVAGFFEAASAINRSAKAMEQLTSRMTKLMDDIEAPMRSFAPEFERAVERMKRVSEVLEGPVDNLVNGLESAVENFDRMSVSTLPEVMEVMGRQLTGFLEMFGELPKRLAPFFPGLRFPTAGSVSIPVSRPVVDVQATRSARPTEGSRLAAESAPFVPAPSVPASSGPASSGPAKRAAPKKVGTKRAAPAKTGAKKAIAGKAAAKKAAPRKSAAKRAPR